MKSRMQSKYYFSKDIYVCEQERIFKKLWLFAGLKTMLLSHNDFITRKVAGVPIVLQNIDGEIHAFENICLHRGMPLQTKQYGNKQLICSYHGWKYDCNGIPINIPFEEKRYRFQECEKKTFKLREFFIEIVGNLIFINLSAMPINFRDQFSDDLIESLKSSSLSYDSEILTTTWRVNYNWKLAGENLRDFNHVQFIHSKTLSKVMDFSDGAIDESSIVGFNQLNNSNIPPKVLESLLRSFSFGGIPNGMARFPLPKYGYQDQLLRWGDTDGYFNWLAYPNLHIASGDGGHAFSIENYIPVDPETTDIEIFCMTAKKKKSYASSHNVLLSMINGSKDIVGEDVKAMELIQSVLHSSGPSYNQGDYEYLNKFIELWYTNVIEQEDNH